MTTIIVEKYRDMTKEDENKFYLDFKNLLLAGS